MITLITRDSGKWLIDKKQVNLFNDDLFRNNISIFVNISDNDFSIIYDLLNSSNKYNILENYENDVLYRLYKIADYLDILIIQTMIGKIIASRFNKMNIEELKCNIDIIYL